MASSYRAAFFTLGCRVSQYETEAVRESFLAAGFRVAEEGQPADAVVLNTCTVTAESDRKSAKTIRRAIRENPGAVILVIGCYAERSAAEIARIPGVSYISGTANKMACADTALRLLREREAGTPPRRPEIAVLPLAGTAYEPMSVSTAPRTRAYIKIADGCDCHCTYCAISAARGSVRSRPREEILEEIRRLAGNGTREVVLTGIETAAYGRDLGNYRLIDLLEEADTLPVDRIRLGSLSPEVLTEDFLTRASRLTHLAPHFHLSVQSAADPVLAAMKRRYNAAWLYAAVDRARALIPEVAFTCDMLIGFPGESKEDFAATLKFSEYAHFLHMHIFPFSPRAGTPAASYPGQIPLEEKRARCRELKALGARMHREILSETVAAGRELPVLFETADGEYATGHTPSFTEVRVRTDLDLHGRILPVLPTGILGDRVTGRLACAGEDLSSAGACPCPDREKTAAPAGSFSCKGPEQAAGPEIP